jgi:hypothetical protein
MVSVYGAAAGASARPAMGEPRSSVPTPAAAVVVISQGRIDIAERFYSCFTGLAEGHASLAFVGQTLGTAGT